MQRGVKLIMRMKPGKWARDFIVRFTLTHKRIETTQAMPMNLRTVLSSQNLDTIAHKDFIAMAQRIAGYHEICARDFGVGMVATSMHGSPTRT